MSLDLVETNDPIQSTPGREYRVVRMIWQPYSGGAILPNHAHARRVIVVRLSSIGGLERTVLGVRVVPLSSRLLKLPAQFELKDGINILFACRTPHNILHTFDGMDVEEGVQLAEEDDG